jgi:hypothetical protein
MYNISLGFISVGISDLFCNHMNYSVPALLLVKIVWLMNTGALQTRVGDFLSVKMQWGVTCQLWRHCCSEAVRDKSTGWGTLADHLWHGWPLVTWLTTCDMADHLRHGRTLATWPTTCDMAERLRHGRPLAKWLNTCIMANHLRHLSKFDLLLPSHNARHL